MTGICFPCVNMLLFFISVFIIVIEYPQLMIPYHSLFCHAPPNNLSTLIVQSIFLISPVPSYPSFFAQLSLSVLRNDCGDP